MGIIYITNLLQIDGLLEKDIDNFLISSKTNDGLLGKTLIF